MQCSLAQKVPKKKAEEKDKRTSQVGTRDLKFGKFKDLLELVCSLQMKFGE